MMLRRLLPLLSLLALLASLPGCVAYDPGYYYYDRGYYYGPYLYPPIWFGGYYYFGDFGHRHDYRGYRHYGHR